MKTLLVLCMIAVSCVFAGCGHTSVSDNTDMTGEDTTQTGSLTTGNVTLQTGELGSHTGDLSSASSLRQNGIHREGDVVVTNIEQVTYAIALPLEGFKEDTEGDYDRGQHVFMSKDPESGESISVQGFIVDTAEPFTLTQKLDRLKEQTELDGLAFIDGHINEGKNSIVVNGRLPNLPGMLFTDIYFYFTCDGGSAFTDSVVVSMVYDEADAAKWQEDINFIQQAGVQHVCE